MLRPKRAARWIAVAWLTLGFPAASAAQQGSPTESSPAATPTAPLEPAGPEPIPIPKIAESNEALRRSFRKIRKTIAPVARIAAIEQELSDFGETLASDRWEVDELLAAQPSRGLLTDTERRWIGALLGHRQASTTDRYAHLADDPIRSASELVGSRIAAALESHEEAPILEMEASKRRRDVRSGRRGGANGGQSTSRGVSGADPKSPETGRF